MRKFILSALFISISWSVQSQRLIGIEHDNIIVTYRDLSFGKKKYNASHRFHASYQGEGRYIFESNNSDKLPAYFKNFKITGSSTETRLVFTRAEVFKFAKISIDSQVTSLLKDTLFFKNSAAKQKLITAYKKNTEKYFSGKHAGPFFTNNWIPLYSATLTDVDNSLTIDAGGRFFKKVRYKTDQLPAAYAAQLPAVDTMTCVPFDRFHELRRMKGYGIDKFRYVPYKMPGRQTVRQQFEIYFDKNSAFSQTESVQVIADYLRNNNYSILNANLEGYSSIEGDIQQNIRLQQKRARVLFNLLQKYNTEPVMHDTVLINPGYNIFRQSIRNTSYQWLDSLSDEKIRTTVNSNHILLSALEPYLKLQRKAVLNLVVAKRIEDSEVFERFKTDFTRLEKKLDPKFTQGESPADVEAQVMGMLGYLFNLLENDFVTPDEVAELLDHAWSKEMVRVMAVYHHLIQVEKKPGRDSLDWNAISKKYNYNKLFLVAQKNLITLISNPAYSKQREKFRRQLVDIQTYYFEYTLMGLISLETLCAMEYPDQPEFRGYKLNQLSFLHYLSRFFHVPCEQLRIADQDNFVPYSDHWLDEVRKDVKDEKANVKRKGYLTSDSLAVLEVRNHGEMAYKYPPSFGNENYSALLFYLKKLWVTDEFSIAPHVIISDSFIEFDIRTLANYHIQLWDPFSNYFEDREVQLKEMDKIISLLKRNNTRICPYWLNQLYLDYHLKALQYINLYFEPGNAQQVDIAQRSLQYITNYYSKNAGLVTPRLSIYVLLQLNAFHWIPGKYDGTWYAWNLLKNISAKRALSKDEMYLYKKYIRYYAPADEKP